MSENEDNIHDTILDLEAKLKKNVDLILKLGNSLQGMFMLGPKPLSVYDQQLKHGLGYPNPYTLKQAISQCPKLYLASSLGNSEISLNVRDTEDTLDDASKKSELCELEKQNDFLKDQLLEVSLKHEVELSVLLNHECVDNLLHAKIEQLKKKSIEIQEGLQARIKILEKDVQMCEKQNENVSLDFTMQSLIKERDNVKLEYQKLFNSIKKTRPQTQTEMDKLIGYQSLLCVTPLYKHVIQKKTDVQKSEENYVVSMANVEKGMNAPSSVRSPMIEISHVKNSVLAYSKESAKEIHKTRFSKESTLSKSLDTTYVVSKPKNDVGSTLKANDKVVQIVMWIVDSGCSKHMTGLGHNLFSVGKFCDGDLEVAFCSKTCYVHNLEGDDLLTGGRKSNLYTISISDMTASSPVCLMSKATSTKSWLWHRRLSHLNFGTINDLTRLDLVDGLPKFKYGKDHLCSAYERGKIKKASHPLKLVPNETPDIIKKFIAQAQLNYKTKVCKIRTDNGTKFKNATLKAHYEKLGIMQQFSTARTPKQNGVVKRRNRTLVEAARMMLIFSRLPEFLWAEAVATACFTQNRSIIHTRHNKTPYELLRGRKPNVEYFHVFGSLCYPTNDRDDLGKMKPKADIGVFIGYSETSRGFRIYNRRTKKIMETINVKFDELTAMASEHDCLEPELQRFINHNSSAEEMNTPSKEDLDNLFGPMFEEYFKTKSSDTPINSAAQPTQIHEDSSSTSLIIVDEHEAPPIVTASDEQTSPISLTEADEFNQEDSAHFDGNS
ncbi:retrovirus-related pol polyprotein from transposon TNT 1-94 [Tanacetum coccineum]